ncbi:hypothetical protein [Haloferula sargassicola]|uniref:Uncharacterized protein n=1 Tax=Haloferula sargassicola TaxID=490096 RepID=A0ABP9UPN6_9BACT
MPKDPSQWEIDKAVAAGILADRGKRRLFLGGFAVAMIAMLIFGLFAIDEWLAESILRFAVYWAACGALCLFVLLFALFDALSVIREEKERS